MHKHKFRLRRYRNEVREFMPDLHCDSQERFLALQAFRQRRGVRGQISSAAKYWAMRQFRKEADIFLTCNAKKMPEKRRDKMLFRMTSIAYVAATEWDDVYRNDFHPHALKAGQKFTVKKGTDRFKYQVAARLDRLSRKHPETFLLRISGRPGETLGCMFLRNYESKLKTQIHWACDSLRRGIAFGQNLCHPHNIRLQELGQPILLTTDIVAALQLQAFHVLATGVPPLMAFVPPRYLHIKKGDRVDPIRYPFFTEKRFLHGEDPATVDKLAFAFKAEPVVISRKQFLPHIPLFEKFPKAMLEFMTTGSLLQEPLPHPDLTNW